MANKPQDPKDVRAFAEEYKKDQGDYNNLLRDSIKYLNQALNTYEKIQGKIQGLNKDTINLKTINKDLERSRQKQITDTNRLRDLEKQIQKDGRSGVSNVNEYMKLTNKLTDLEKRRADAVLMGDKNKIDQLNRILKYERNRQDNMKQSMSVDEVAYMTQLQTVELSKKQVAYAQEQYENEKEISKSIGFTGKLLGLTNKYLGVGKNLYGKIVEEAREGVTTTKTMTKIVAGLALSLYGAGKAAVILATSGMQKVGQGMKAIGAEQGPISNLAGSFSGMLKNIPLVGGLLAGVVDSFAMLLDFAVGAKSEIQKMGREIGLSAQESMTMSNNMHNYSIASGKAYLNSKNLLRTHIDINKALDDTNAISGKNVETAYQLTKFAGVEMETVAGLEKLSRVTGKNQANIAGAVANQVGNFKKLTGFGFSFQSVLKEVASMSGYLGLQLAKYPGKMINAVVAAKGLGLELSKLDGMADSFLNFEDSITKQFEAQILTGKEVNLNKARELFLNNELLEAGMEISKQIGSSADFLKMNRIEAASYAEQFGMTRDQMGDFLKQQEQLSAFGVKDTKELQKKVALMKEQGNAQDAINKLGSEEAFNKLVASSATEDLSGFIEKIKESFAQLVANTGLADMVQNFIKFLSEPDNITSILNKIKNVFATIVTVIGSIMGGIMKAINGVAGFFGSDFHIDEGMIDMVTGAGAQIKSFDMGNLVSKKAGGNFGATGVDTSKMYKNETDAQAALRQANISAGGIEKYQITMVMEGQKVAYKIGEINKQNPASSNDGNRFMGSR